MAKFTKNTTKFTIYDSARSIDFDEIRDYCECNDIEIPKEDSNAYWDIVRHIRDWECEDFWDNIKFFNDKLNNQSVMVTGTLGLWNGHPTIIPTLVDNFEEAIRKMCGNSIMDLKVEYDGGVINVYASHHDGTNCYEIHKLSKAGRLEIERPKYYYEDFDVKDWWFQQFKIEEFIY